MPTNSSDHLYAAFGAGFWRKEAEKWERVASSADKDGDKFHAAHARNEAANCRQKARLQEAEISHDAG